MRATPTVTILLLSLALAACEQKSFSQKFDQLATGMSQQDVEKIMGKGTKQDVGGVGISASGIAGGASQNSQITYVWQDGVKEIAVTFQNGKVVNKGKSRF
jgi:hypothetical protein